MALRAFLEDVKKESLHISKSLKYQNNKYSRKGTPTKNKRTKEKSKKGKGKGNKDTWAWKKMPPSEGDSNAKKKDKKEFN